MTGKKIENIILNYEMTEDLLWEYLEIDFKETIETILRLLYNLLLNYNDNKKIIDNILYWLELLAKTEKKQERVVILHSELKVITGKIYKNLDMKTFSYISEVTNRIHTISGFLSKTKIMNNNIAIIEALELIIYENRNLDVIAAFIRDNKKNILKIKDQKEKNILYKLLERYSSLKETDKEEIKYLFQVISLFINDDAFSVEIAKNCKYYFLALKNRSLGHVKEIMSLIDRKAKVSINSLPKRYNIYVKPSTIIERELKELEILHSNFVDFSDRYSFTIDGIETTCLDDALYWEKNRDGTYTLHVYITYLPALIRYNSKIFENAMRQGETIYLEDSAIPFLPNAISSNLASLLPNQIRHTLTGIWTIAPDMTIIEDSFMLKKSIIRSHQRLSYDETDSIIGNKSRDDLGEALYDLGRFTLKQKRMNSKKMSKNAPPNDYLDIDIPNAGLLDTSVSANIIQICMVLYGHSVAKFAQDNELSYINRACGEQQSFKLNGSLLDAISSKGIECCSKKSAYYTIEPELHSALGDIIYSHSSSPARRGSDLMNQFALEHTYFTPNVSDSVKQQWEDILRGAAVHLNKTIPRNNAYARHYNYLRKELVRKNQS